MNNSVIEEQIKGVSFEDDRLRKRYEFSLSRIQARDWSQSFPNLIKDSYELKGFYRFINNTRIDQSTFIKGYMKGLVSYSTQLSEQEEKWYLIHGTMYAEYNNRELDLGYTQSHDTNGFLLHHGLLLNHQSIPLGLLHQGIIHRDREDFGKRIDCKKKAIEDKESFKWIEGLNAGKDFGKASVRRLIHILDREADIAEVINLFLKPDSVASDFIIRARHDRSTLTHTQRGKEDDVGMFRLFTQIKKSNNYKKIHRTLRSKDGKSYDAECWLRYDHYKFRGNRSIYNVCSFGRSFSYRRI